MKFLLLSIGAFKGGICASILLFSLLADADEAGSLKPFESDGCSLFPDSNIITNDQWCQCCLLHDIAYWQGGTKQQRLVADIQLRECVERQTGDEVLARVMYEGVRLGGSPYFYNWYRWGYGWPYAKDFAKKYQPLTAAEYRQVERLLDDYLQSNSTSVCQ